MSYEELIKKILVAINDFQWQEYLQPDIILLSSICQIVYLNQIAGVTPKFCSDAVKTVKYEP